MTKLSNDHKRTLWHTLRFSAAEKATIQKLATRSKARTVSGYIRAAALNKRDDGEVFRDILNQQIEYNRQIREAVDPDERKRIVLEVEQFMRWVMDRK